MVEILFGILNGLRGGGHLSRPIMALAITMLVYFSTSINLIQFFALFPLIWLGFLFGWSLGAISGTFDWDKKFAPSGWLIKLLGIKDPFIAGGVGMSVRWLVFAPAIALVNGYDALWLTPALCAVVGLTYFLAGRTENTDATRIAEFFSGVWLGLVLVTWPV